MWHLKSEVSLFSPGCVPLNFSCDHLCLKLMQLDPHRLHFRVGSYTRVEPTLINYFNFSS